MTIDYNGLAAELRKKHSTVGVSRDAGARISVAPSASQTESGGFWNKTHGFIARTVGSTLNFLSQTTDFALDKSSSAATYISGAFIQGLGIAKDVYTSKTWQEMLANVNSRDLKFSDFSKYKEDSALTKYVGSKIGQFGTEAEGSATKYADKRGLGNFGQGAADITGEIAGFALTAGLGGLNSGGLSFAELATGTKMQIAKKFALRAATVSPLETAAFIAGSEGRMPTKNEVGVGLLIDFVAGGAFGAAAKYMNKKKLIGMAKKIENGLAGEQKNALLTEAGVTTIDEWMKSVSTQAIKEKQPFQDVAMKKLTDLLSYTTDTMIPMERYLADSYFEAGIDKFALGSKYNVSNAGDEALRYKAKGDQLIMDTGFNKIITAPVSYSEFTQLDKYLQAKRVIELQGVQEVFPMTLAQAKEGVALLGPKFQAYGDVMRKHNHAVLDVLVEAQILSKDFAEGLKKEFPDFVPMDRVVDTFQAGTSNFVSKTKIGSLSKQTILKRLSKEGSTAEVRNVVDTVYKNTYDAVKQAQVNKVANAIIAQRDLSKELFEAITPIRTYEGVMEKSSAKVVIADMNKQIKDLTKLLSSKKKTMRKLASEIRKDQKLGANVLKQFVPDEAALNLPVTEKSVTDLITMMAEQPVVRRALKKILRRKGMSKNAAKEIDAVLSLIEEAKSVKGGAKDVIKQLEELDTRGIPYITRIKYGVKEIWQVPEEIALSAKYMTPEGLGNVAAVANEFNRAFKLGTTVLNLTLTPALYAYDEVSAFTNIMPGAAKYLNPIFYPEIYLKSWYQSAAKRLGLKASLYDDLRRQAVLGNQFDLTRQGVATGPDAISKKFKADESIVGITLDTPKKALAAIEHIMSIPEEAVRMRVYLATQRFLEKSGKYTKDQITTAAANETRNVTGNYYRKGVHGALLNATFTYFGAWQAGTRSFVRAAVNSPKSFAKKAGGLATLAAAITAWNVMDPRRRAVYEQIQNNDKDRSIVILGPDAYYDEATGRVEGLVKFPFANEMSFIFNPTRRMIESHFTNEPETARKIGLDLVNSFSYINMSNLEGWLDIPKRIISGGLAAVPMLRTPVEEITNYDLYFGGPKYSRTEMDSGISKETSAVAQIIGEELGVKPLHIQGAVEGFFGSTAGDALRVMDSLLVYLGIATEGQKSNITMASKFKKKYISAAGGKWESELYDRAQAASDADSQASALKSVMNERAGTPSKGSDLSSIESKLKSLGVKSGAKADVLYDYLSKLPPEEAQVKYSDWRKKGIISGAVVRQLRKKGLEL